MLQSLQASDPAHPNIHKNQIRCRTVLNLFNSLLPARSRIDLVSLTPQDSSQGIADFIIIVDDKHRELTVLDLRFAHLEIR